VFYVPVCVARACVAYLHMKEWRSYSRCN